MVERLGYPPIEDKHRDQMNQIAAMLDRIFNGKDAEPQALQREGKRKIGFVLLVFPFGKEQEGRCNFISNGADRRDLIVLFREMIARLEGQPEITGHA